MIQASERSEFIDSALKTHFISLESSTGLGWCRFDGFPCFPAFQLENNTLRKIEMEKATLSPGGEKLNGGEFHDIAFKLDEEGNLEMEVSACCYGTHATSFGMIMSEATADELERFAIDLTVLARKMRDIRAKS
jgi:hypothetical protein